MINFVYKLTVTYYFDIRLKDISNLITNFFRKYFQNKQSVCEDFANNPAVCFAFLKLPLSYSTFNV